MPQICHLQTSVRSMTEKRHGCLSGVTWYYDDRFNTVLEMFLRNIVVFDVHPHANLLFHHIPKVIYWREIWRLWRPLEFNESSLKVMFSNLFLFRLGESVWTLASVSSLLLSGLGPGVALCCCSPSASRLTVLCVQSWYSADRYL